MSLDSLVMATSVHFGSAEEEEAEEEEEEEEEEEDENTCLFAEDKDQWIGLAERSVFANLSASRWHFYLS